MDLTTTLHALKEWSVAIDALETGKTIMLLRKGGIHEKNGRFQVAHEQVLLFPTFEHQQPFLLKSEYANLIYPVTPGWHPENIRIGSYAQITHVLPISQESTVNTLLPFHIWNEHFISDRLKWKPSQPLYVLLLRTYKLPQPQEVPYRSEYGGCKSWIDLAQPINTQGSTPVLLDPEYSKIVEEIRGQVTGKSQKSKVKSQKAEGEISY